MFPTLIDLPFLTLYAYPLFMGIAWGVSYVLAQYFLDKKQIDSSYFLKTKKVSYGYDVLTNQKQFYQENYPEIIIEKNNFDTLFSMMLRG